MVHWLATVRLSDCTDEWLKERPLHVRHQISRQDSLPSESYLESRQAIPVNPFCQHGLEKAGLNDEQIEAQCAVLDKLTAAGRAGRPDEMTGSALFSTSDNSSCLFGADLRADGGMIQTR
jgi:hypothetical protein